MDRKNHTPHSIRVGQPASRRSTPHRTGRRPAQSDAESDSPRDCVYLQELVTRGREEFPELESPVLVRGLPLGLELGDIGFPLADASVALHFPVFAGVAEFQATGGLDRTRVVRTDDEQMVVQWDQDRAVPRNTFLGTSSVGWNRPSSFCPWKKSSRSSVRRRT